jgi:hypothetical protein
LADASQSDAVAETVTKWIDRTGELNTIDVLPLAAGQDITFVHRHAILASSVLRLVALDLNAIALSRLGTDGVVFLAARRLFIDRPPSLEILSTKSVAHAMHAVLGDRYRVMGLTAAETRQIMRDLDIWQECNRRLQIFMRGQDRLLT